MITLAGYVSLVTRLWRKEPLQARCRLGGFPPQHDARTRLIQAMEWFEIGLLRSSTQFTALQMRHQTLGSCIDILVVLIITIATYRVMMRNGMPSRWLVHGQYVIAGKEYRGEWQFCEWRGHAHVISAKSTRTSCCDISYKTVVQTRNDSNQ
jgi:hypothetical protein